MIQSTENMSCWKQHCLDLDYQPRTTQAALSHIKQFTQKDYYTCVHSTKTCVHFHHSPSRNIDTVPWTVPLRMFWGKGLRPSPGRFRIGNCADSINFPTPSFFILLIRGLFDAFYQKALMTEEAWKEGSRGRSYEDFLRHYDAIGLLEHTETLKWHQFGCQQPISRTFKIRSLLCGSKINWELTDRATLLADKVAERINMKSGARTLAIIVMARFSSPELNRRILASLPQGKPKCSEEDFLDHVEHVSELMQKSFFASEFNRVARMTAEDATSFSSLTRQLLAAALHLER